MCSFDTIFSEAIRRPEHRYISHLLGPIAGRMERDHSFVSWKISRIFEKLREKHAQHKNLGPRWWNFQVFFIFTPSGHIFQMGLPAGHGAWHVTEVVERGWLVKVATKDVVPDVWIFSFIRVHLGGGFKYLYFHPENWGKNPFWLIFFKWVETTN